MINDYYANEFSNKSFSKSILFDFVLRYYYFNQKEILLIWGTNYFKTMNFKNQANLFADCV